MKPYRVQIHSNSGSHYFNGIVMAVDRKSALEKAISMIDAEAFERLYDSLHVNCFLEQQAFFIKTK